MYTWKTAQDLFEVGSWQEEIESPRLPHGTIYRALEFQCLGCVVFTCPQVCYLELQLHRGEVEGISVLTANILCIMNNSSHWNCTSKVSHHQQGWEGLPLLHKQGS